MDKNSIFIALIVLILGGFIGYFIYTSRAEKDGAEDTVIRKVEQNIEAEEEVDTVGEGQGAATAVSDAIPGPKDVDGAETTDSIPVPDLDKDIVIPDSYPLEQKEKITNKIKDIIVFLKQDPNLFNEWLDLGLLRKSIEDYEGAREAWEYASAIRPKNSLSFGNLGVLYGYYLQNPIHAEKNYLKSIENDPKLPYLYVRVADFYLEVLDSPEKAKGVLERGITAIPADEALKVALENL